MATIGIDYTAAYEQGAGIGRYVRPDPGAAAAIDPPTGCSWRCPARWPSPAPGPNFQWRPTRITPRWFARLCTGELPLPVETFTGRVRLFHATDFTLPPAPGTKTLPTVHDLSPVRAPEPARRY